MGCHTCTRGYSISSLDSCHRNRQNTIFQYFLAFGLRNSGCSNCNSYCWSPLHCREKMLFQKSTIQARKANETIDTMQPADHHWLAGCTTFIHFKGFEAKNFRGKDSVKSCMLEL